MKRIEVSFTLDIKMIIIIILAGWLLFSGYLLYHHTTANKRNIQGNASSIQAIVSYLNNNVRPQPTRIPQTPKEEVKKNGK